MNLAKKSLVVCFLSLMLSLAVFCKTANAIIMPDTTIEVPAVLDAEVSNIDNGNIKAVFSPDVLTVSNDSRWQGQSKSFVSLEQSDIFLKFNVTDFAPNSSAQLEIYGYQFGNTNKIPSVEAFNSTNLRNKSFDWNNMPSQISGSTLLTPVITNPISGPLAPELFTFTISNISQYETIGKNGQEYLTIGIEQPIGTNHIDKLYGVNFIGNVDSIGCCPNKPNLSPELVGTSTPTPEPSSLILGFMSLAGLSRLKRKTNN